MEEEKPSEEVHSPEEETPAKEEPKEEPEPEQKEEPKVEEEPKKEEPPKPKKPRVPLKEKLNDIYTNKYKTLLIIPFLMLLLAFAQLGFQAATTGDFINRGISLKGGLSVTIPLDTQVDILDIERSLESDFPANDINVRTLSSAGNFLGIIVEADLDISNKESVDSLVSSISNVLDKELTEDDYSIEGIGSSLGASFFREAAVAMLIAFLFMGIVVFIYFRNLAPSFAVILAAFSDIVVTLAIINLMGIKMSTSGIVALLLLIGYSVDTDIVLSTKVLKRKEGTVMHRIYNAMKTGLTMTSTTVVAVIVAMVFTQSIVIKQIMLILLIGLLVDVINTWIQNVGLIRLFIEKRHKK